MGYESSLHLLDIKIKPQSTDAVRKTLKSGKARGPSALRYFLQRVALDSNGFLIFKASRDGVDPYVPDEEGTVPASYGKWYEAERIARWVSRHSQKGGRIILHSTEADGEAWGWEFDGHGRMRAIRLRPIGKWG